MQRDNYYARSNGTFRTQPNILCEHLLVPRLKVNYEKQKTGKETIKIIKLLLHCTSICVSSKSVSKVFKILSGTGDINIFVLRGVFFSRHVQPKSSFSDETNISGEI